MHRKPLEIRNAGFLWLVALVLAGVFGSVPALAGSSVIGSVAGSMNSTVGGQPLLPNSVIFSGDTVRVADGAAVVAMSGGSRFVFGRETDASLLRDDDGVTVLLGRGDVAVYDAGAVAGLRVKVGDLSVVPEKGFKTLGEVAMLGGAVVLTVKRGAMRVEGPGSGLVVTEGKTITIQPKTLRAPQATTGGGGGSHRPSPLVVTALSVGVVGAILGAIGISRANTATSTANAASSTAAAAADAAAAAAKAAQQATNLAAAVAGVSLLDTNIVGCELNTLANSEGKPSPYTPPPGLSCP